MGIGPKHATFLLLLLPLCAARADPGAAAPGDEPDWHLRGGGATSIELYPHLLSDLGLSIERAVATAPGGHEGEMVFRVRPDSALRLEGAYGSFQRFKDGLLHHDGGFDLVWAGGGQFLHRFELRPAARSSRRRP